MTNERELADHTYGQGWSAKVDRTLKELKETTDRIERGIKKIGTDQTRNYEEDKKWKNRIERRVDALEEGKSDGNDDEEITGVQSVDELRRKARGQRARARNIEERSLKYKRHAKVIAPILVGIGVAVAELADRIIQVLK